MSSNNCLLPQKPPKPSSPILPFLSPKMCKLVPDISFCSDRNMDDFASKQGTMHSYMPNREGKFKPNANSKTEQMNNLKLSEEKTHISEFILGAGHDNFSSLDLPINSFQEQHKFKPVSKTIYDSSVCSSRSYINKNSQKKQNSRPEEICNAALKCPCCVESHLNFNDQNKEINLPCQEFEPFRIQETLNENVAQTVSHFSATEMSKCSNDNECHLSHRSTSKKQTSDKSTRFQANSKCHDDTVKQMQVLMNRNEEMFEYIKSHDKKLYNLQEQVSYLLNEHSKLKNDIFLVQQASENSNLISPLKDDIESQLQSFFKVQSEQIQQLQKKVTMLVNMENRKTKHNMSENLSMGTDNFNSDSMRKNVGDHLLLDASSQTTDGFLSDTRTMKNNFCSVGTMTNFTVIKDNHIGKINKIGSSKQIHDSKSKPRKSPVDTNIVISEKSPKNNLESSCGQRITSPKNKPSCPEEINVKVYNSESKDDHNDSTLTNESGSCRRCSLENTGNVSEDFRQKVMGNIEKIISKPETKSPNVPKTCKPISPTQENNHHRKLEQCTRQENRLIEKANKTSLHNTVVPKHLSKMANCSSDMSYEFQRMKAKYLNTEDILEVQTSFSVIREKFSHSSCEYLQLHGFLKK